MIVAAVVVLGGAVVALPRHNDDQPYRVAAIFDTAKGMVTGQQVKVAGAEVGKVQEVRLTPGLKARMVMEVDSRFEPFRGDASCRILPQGLISENYVECDPGSAGRQPLARGKGGVPTVSLGRTTVPVSVQDAINVFSLPTDQQLRVLIHELGLATAGRGEDLNEILRRANPALTQSRRALAILDAQRRQIASAVGQTDRVLARLAERKHEVSAFVDRAAAVSRTSAQHRRALSETVRRLPPMLDAVRPGLHSLDRATISAAPLLDQLRATAPGLESLTRTLPAFSRAGVPALRKLGAAAAKGRRAVRSAKPVVSLVRKTATAAQPFARHLDQLLVSMRDQGAIEGTLKLFYALATDSAAYDEISHILSLYVGAYPDCFADSPPAECVHAYSGPDRGTAPVNGPRRGPAGPPNPRADPKPVLDFLLK